MIRERILQYIESKNISKYHFYQITGFSNGFLDKEGSIGSDKCERIIYSFPDLNLEWLITGKGSMLREDTYITVNEPDFKVYNGRTKSTNHIGQVPLYDIKSVTGVVSIFESLQNQQPIAYLDIPNLPKCDGAIHIVGDSMYPLLKSGDIVIYKIINSLENLFWGEMYLLSIVNHDDTFITIKYLQKSDRDGFIRLVNFNQHYQDKEMPIEVLKHAALIKASIHYNVY